MIGQSMNISGGLNDWAGMSSPISAASYDLQTNTLNLSLGSREPLTLDERIDRLRATRAEAEAAAIAARNDSTAEDEEESVAEVISPNISASLGSNLEEFNVEAFELFRKDGEIWMKGGLLTRAKYIRFDVPTTNTQIVEGKPAGVKLIKATIKIRIHR